MSRDRSDYSLTNCFLEGTHEEANFVRSGKSKDSKSSSLLKVPVLPSS